MVTTHSWYLKSDDEINVPYSAIDQALDLTDGTTKKIWDKARAGGALAAAQTYEAAFPQAALGGDDEWGGNACIQAADYIRILKPDFTDDDATAISYK